MAAAPRDRSLPEPVPPVSTAEASRLTSKELMDLATRAFRVRCSQDAVIATVSAELDRREAWRTVGATSLPGFLEDRLGVSPASARSYAVVADRITDLPRLANGLEEGRISLDKLQVASKVAEPETDAEWAELASTNSVRNLKDIVRSEQRPTAASDQAANDNRSVRFNKENGTMVAKLPPVSFGAIRSVVERRAKQLPSDGETRFDQRMADALVSLLTSDNRSPGSAAPPLLVAHAPIDVLLNPTSTLSGELERGGLVSAEVVRRLSCDATIVIGVDDGAGHTMYEGRERRFPTEAQRREVRRRDRHCRFPGCHNELFTNCHHMEEWSRGGRTDLPNLVLLCEHHHHLIHSNVWSMEGDANVELRFVGPSGEVMTTRPSLLWTNVTKPRRKAPTTGRNGQSGAPASNPSRERGRASPRAGPGRGG